MPTLFLMRGAPGSGKSRWAAENGIEGLVVSSDQVRLDLLGIERDSTGRFHIPQRHQNLVWATVRDRIEDRMGSGDPVVLDANNLRTEHLSQWLPIADRHGYGVAVVDFTDIGADKCKVGNLEREDFRRVPEHVIDDYFSMLPDNPVPDGIEVIDRRHFLNRLGSVRPS